MRYTAWETWRKTIRMPSYGSSIGDSRAFALMRKGCWFQKR